MRRRGIAIDRLSSEDARILRLERGAIGGHTCKVLVLEPVAGRPLPTVASLRKQIDARLDLAPRLRQRVVGTPLRVAAPVWLDDPHFSIERHVSTVQTRSDGGEDELEQIVARLMIERLDHSRPLWHLDVVEQLQDGSMALIWRLHHALADGTTSVRLGSAVLWSEDPAPEQLVATQWRPGATPGAAALFASGLATRARLPIRHRHPALRMTRSRSGVASVVRRELGATAALTPLACRVGPGRTIALAQVPLSASRRAGKALGETVTVNDVALALLAGGVRAWLEVGHGPQVGIRAKVPVSLHRHDADDDAANRDSYFFVDLPVAEPDTAKRVLAINRETAQRKLGHDAETLYRLGQHPFVAHWAMSPHVFTFNVSNVRGPSDDIYVLGARVREFYSLAEIAPRHALRTAILSSGDSLSFGLCADATAVPNLNLIVDGIRRSTDELLVQAGI